MQQWNWNNHLPDEALGYTGKIKAEQANQYDWKPDDWQPETPKPSPKPKKEGPPEYAWSDKPTTEEKIREIV
jgi:hypothetical protein